MAVRRPPNKQDAVVLEALPPEIRDEVVSVGSSAVPVVFGDSHSNQEAATTEGLPHLGVTSNLDLSSHETLVSLVAA